MRLDNAQSERPQAGLRSLAPSLDDGVRESWRSLKTGFRLAVEKGRGLAAERATESDRRRLIVSSMLASSTGGPTNMNSIIRAAAPCVFVLATSGIAQARDINEVIQTRAEELHFQQACGGEQVIDTYAARLIGDTSGGDDRLIATLQSLRAASSAPEGSKATCAAIKKRLGR